MLLKIKFRTILNHRKTSLISMASLVIGIVSVTLLLHYIVYESGYDKFYTNYNSVFRVIYHRSENSNIIESAGTPSRLPIIIRDEIPEIEASTRVIKEIPLVYTDHQNKFTDQTLLWVDAGFIDVFSLKIINGDINNALSRPHTTVVSSSMAQRYFGNENPIGKTITVNEGFPLEITAVCEDFPKNSHLNFDFLTNISTALEYNWVSQTGSWRLSNTYTYIRISKGVSSALINNKLSELVSKHIQPDENQKIKFQIQPINQIHLTSHLSREFNNNADLKTINILKLILAGILLLTWINYFNLITTSTLDKDYKEWYIRKIQGAGLNDILYQNTISNLLLHSIALILSLFLVFLILPVFANLTGKPIPNTLLNFEIIILFLFILFIGSLTSALFQTYFINGVKFSGGFKPEKMQKNKMFTFQRILGVSQFASSITFIILIIGFQKQVNFMQSQDLGIDLTQTLIIPAPYSLNNDTTKEAKFEYLKSELMAKGIISNMGASRFIPGSDIRPREINVSIDELSITAEIMINNIDCTYLNIYKHTLLAGRNFRLNENGANILINENMVKLLGFTSPAAAIDKSIKMNNSQNARIIIGVVKNANYKGLTQTIAPLIFQYESHPEDFGFYSAGIFTANLNKSIKTIENVWNELYPVDPINPYFADDNFNAQYNDIKKSIRIFSLFTLLAIIISCIGLIGVSILNSIKRIKEIGVRKVNGATIYEVLILLNKDFVKWVILAFGLATPIAWYILHKWLESFAYKTELSWWVFALAGLMALFIALLTISYQTYKAAIKNPVESLRYE